MRYTQNDTRTGKMGATSKTAPAGNRGLAPTIPAKENIVTTEEQSTATPTSVYRYYDTNGLLLYVGITNRGISRNREHNTSKEWWPYVTRQEVEHYATRAEALRAEKSLIQTFRPPFNVQHNPDSATTRAAYLAITEAVENTPAQWQLGDMVKRLNRRIPLEGATVSRDGRSVTLSTPVRFFPLVGYFEEYDCQKDGTQIAAQGAGKGGRITWVRKAGGVLAIRVRGERAAEVVAGELLFKFRTQKPPTLMPSQVLLVKRQMVGAA